MYQNTLIKWKGQLNVFPKTAEMVDEILHTSFILPQKITTDKKLLKKVSTTLGKQLLTNATNIMEGGKMQFFFIAQIIAQTVEKSKKPLGEITLALMSLINANILQPMKLEEKNSVPSINN